MALQRKTEWENIGEEELKYHLKQYENPYRSTVVFCEWLNSLGVFEKPSDILDICCGAGANLYYMKTKYNAHNFCGVEYNPALVSMANKVLESQLGSGVVQVFEDDLYNLKRQYSVEGITMYQTLSWLPEYQGAMEALVGLHPNWIGLTSLFTESDIDAEIQMKDYTRNKEFYYNIYSLERVKARFAGLGYNNFHYMRYDIDIDLPQDPGNKGIGTYTETLESGRRIQFSGPIWMNWYFIYAEK